MKFKNATRWLVMAVLFFGVLGSRHTATAAQGFSNQQSVALSLTVGESVSITATPANISFTPGAGGTATASGPITVSTTWSLASGRTQMRLYSWLGSATAALASAQMNIPSSDVFDSIDGGGAMACTGADATVPAEVSGATCPWVSVTTGVPGGTAGTANHTELLSLSGLPQLLAATYTGTVFYEVEYQ